MPRFELAERNMAAGQRHDEAEKIQAYLQRYGYLASAIEPKVLDAPTQEALLPWSQSRQEGRIEYFFDLTIDNV